MNIFLLFYFHCCAKYCLAAFCFLFVYFFTSYPSIFVAIFPKKYLLFLSYSGNSLIVFLLEVNSLIKSVSIGFGLNDLSDVLNVLNHGYSVSVVLSSDFEKSSGYVTSTVL